MSKAQLLADSDPWARLALGILDMARDDAKGGDLAALAWLVGPGYDLAERIDPRAGGLMLLRWCTTLFEQLQAARQAGGRGRRLGYWPELEAEQGGNYGI